MLAIHFMKSESQTFRQATTRALRRAYRGAQLGDLSVSVALTSDAEVRALNHRWRGVDRATDVLSFSAWDGEEIAGMDAVLGDVIISTETARRQARACAHPVETELVVLFVHGLLHLLGLDHERGADDARRQAECEMTILAAAGVDVDAALIGRTL